MVKNKIILVGYLGWVKNHLLLILFCTMVCCINTKYLSAQIIEKEYTNLNDALKEPEKVLKLNLQNQPDNEFLNNFRSLKI